MNMNVRCSHTTLLNNPGGISISIKIVVRLPFAEVETFGDWTCSVPLVEACQVAPAGQDLTQQEQSK